MKTIRIRYTVEVPDNFTGKIMWEDGDTEYRKNGIRHREDGPALIYSTTTKFYYQNGKYHRIGGPAVEYVDGTAGYYINGKHITKEQHDLLVLMLKLKETII